METLLVEAPGWNNVYRSFNGDGTATYWANSFLPIWGRLCAIASFVVSGGTVPVGGVTLHGTSTGSGMNLIGMPAIDIGGWSGGTAFAFLEATFEVAFELIEGRLSKSGGIMTGPIVFREPVVLPDTATHTMTVQYDFATIADVSQLSNYTLPNPTEAGRWMLVRRHEYGGGFQANINRADATVLASFPDSGRGTVLFVTQPKVGGFEWTCWFGVGAAVVA